MNNAASLTQGGLCWFQSVIWKRLPKDRVTSLSSLSLSHMLQYFVETIQRHYFFYLHILRTSFKIVAVNLYFPMQFTASFQAIVTLLCNEMFIYVSENLKNGVKEQWKKHTHTSTHKHTQTKRIVPLMSWHDEGNLKLIIWVSFINNSQYFLGFHQILHTNQSLTIKQINVIEDLCQVNIYWAIL